MNTKYQESYDYGLKIERTFHDVLKEFPGWVFIRDATPDENRLQKWDELWRFYGKACRIQIKGDKSRRRGVEPPSTTLLVLEFKVEDRDFGNVYDGWLKGNYEVVAFKLGNAFYLFYRKRLLEWAEKVAIYPAKEKPNNPKEVVNYQVYYRWMHPKEEIMYVPMKDMIKNLPYKEIPCNVENFLVV